MNGDGKQPPLRWLLLARAWLDMSDEERVQMIRAAEMGWRYGDRMVLPEEFAFSDVAPQFYEMWKATEKRPFPELLMPVMPDVADDDDETTPETAVSTLPEPESDAGDDTVVEMVGSVDDTDDAAWLNTKQIMQEEIAPSLYETWIENMQLVNVDGDRFEIGVANDVAQKILTRQWTMVLERTLTLSRKRPSTVEFVVQSV